MDSKQARERASAAPRRQGRAESAKPGGTGLPNLWTGLPWMSPWLDLWASVWTSWLGGGPLTAPRPGHKSGEGTRRQEDGLSWLPRLETTVIPLRRRTDPPGEQAEKISLRMQMPWLGGGNVIAIDTVVARSPSDYAVHAEPPAEASARGKR
jgi:hypothetical protein